MTGLVQEPPDQHVDAAVEGRGEQHPLAVAAGSASSSRRDHRQEAEVGHVVGLVEHGDLDGVEAAVALLDQVLEPAGAGDDDVDAAAQGGDLRVLADAAEDGEGAQAGGLGQRLRGPRRSGWPARGSAPGSARAARLGRGGGDRGGQPGEQREQERVGLAGAGAAAAEHVAAGERVGQRGGLDRGRGGDAVVGQHRRQVRGHAEVDERR